jgi:hypothetical protein
METDITAIGPVRSQTEEHDFKDATQIEAQNDSDANSLSRVISGPPYSIFSDKTKAFIVFMGKSHHFISARSQSRANSLRISLFTNARTSLLTRILPVCLSALISPFAATLFYPALNVLAEQLHVSDSLVNLSITTYMVRCDLSLLLSCH